MNKDKKGLSPVVAAIILIAVTVAVSIAVAAWVGSIIFPVMKPVPEFVYYDNDIVRFNYNGTEYEVKLQEGEPVTPVVDDRPLAEQFATQMLFIEVLGDFYNENITVEKSVLDTEGKFAFLIQQNDFDYALENDLYDITTVYTDFSFGATTFNFWFVLDDLTYEMSSKPVFNKPVTFVLSSDFL